jgi:hypothetical protein
VPNEDHGFALTWRERKREEEREREVRIDGGREGGREGVRGWEAGAAKRFMTPYSIRY